MFEPVVFLASPDFSVFAPTRLTLLRATYTLLISPIVIPESACSQKNSRLRESNQGISQHGDDH